MIICFVLILIKPGLRPPTRAVGFPWGLNDALFHRQLGECSELSGQAGWYSYCNIPQSRSVYNMNSHCKCFIAHKMCIKLKAWHNFIVLSLSFSLSFCLFRNHLGLLHPWPAVFRRDRAYKIHPDLWSSAFLGAPRPGFGFRLNHNLTYMHHKHTFISLSVILDVRIHCCRI